jgi:superfamily II RNA helicase
MNNKKIYDDNEYDYKSSQQVTKDNWEDSDEESSEKPDDALLSIPIEEPVEWLNSSSNQKERTLVQLPVVLQDPTKVRLYIEPKQVIQKTKTKKNASKTDVRNPIIDKHFDDWQKNMAQYLINGSHLVLDVVTSCGKTWVTRNIVAEICLRLDWTAIFVVPNKLILDEVVRGLLIDNKKTYQKKHNFIVSFQTGSLTSFHEQNSQIVVLTADTIMEFISLNSNKFFLSRLKFISCDEIQVESVSTALWRLALIPQQVQFILSSATIGNTDWLVKELKSFRPGNPVNLIRWQIRPIPLQYGVISQDIELSREGAKLKLTELEMSEKVLFCPNLHDLTNRDISYLESLSGKAPTAHSSELNQKDLMNSRNQRYNYGQLLVSELTQSNMNQYQTDLDNNIEKSLNLSAVPSHLVAEKVLAIFQHLNSREMVPALYFERHSANLINLAKKLLAYLQLLENEDGDIKKQLKNIEKAEKDIRRRRDEEDRRKHINYEEDVAKLQLIEVPMDPTKWRFRPFSENVPKKMPPWLADLARYGIGIYTDTLEPFVQDAMFEWFSKKKLAFLLCDMSLSLGINLPARTIILDGELDLTTFQQMGGRAGRRGLDNQGYVLLTSPPSISKALLTSSQSISMIASMPPLNILEILRWNIRYNGYNKNLLKLYIQKYAGIAKQKGMVQEYLRLFQWLIDNNWMTSKYVQLALSLENTGSFCFLQLLRSGLLMKWLPKNLDDAIQPMMTLLAFLWETLPSKDSESILPIELLDGLSLVELARQVGLRKDTDNVIYSNYILKFYRNGENTIELQDNIYRFQKQLSQLLEGMLIMMPKNTEHMVTNLLIRINKVLLDRFQFFI